MLGGSRLSVSSSLQLVGYVLVSIVASTALGAHFILFFFLCFACISYDADGSIWYDFWVFCCACFPLWCLFSFLCC